MKNELSKCCGVESMSMDIAIGKGVYKGCSKCGKPFEPQEVREDMLNNNHFTAKDQENRLQVKVELKTESNSTVKITPSPRIDYCGACKKEHGYDCPLDVKEEVKWCGCNENIENGKCKHTVPVKESDWESSFDKEFTTNRNAHIGIPEANGEQQIITKRVSSKFKDFIRQELLQQRQDLLKELEEKCAEQFNPYCGGDKEGDISCFDKLQNIIKHI